MALASCLYSSVHKSIKSSANDRGYCFCVLYGDQHAGHCPKSPCKTVIFPEKAFNLRVGWVCKGLSSLLIMCSTTILISSGGLSWLGLRVLGVFELKEEAVVFWLTFERPSSIGGGSSTSHCDGMSCWLGSAACLTTRRCWVEVACSLDPALLIDSSIWYIISFIISSKSFPLSLVIPLCLLR